MRAFDPRTLAGVIQHWAATKPDLGVLVVEGAGVREDETRTYAQLWERAQALATGLQRLGVRPGA